ncbi:undecaprenyl-phosphate glucose phosphotransferase [uncultured Microbulbifer sp.]|uniref:undecaprenyl-phosphate glucose phosphotransferase n=1 Tax=uncultured Microbulbifer sp. TaxID=348147 RepID=UPI002639A754|nr:undecaprenyl-phosphate glucose phosphotransferase [uncultured Microbulbifer sp.]
MRSLYAGLLREFSLLLTWLTRFLDLAVLWAACWLAYGIVFEGRSFGFRYLVAFVIAAALSFSVYPYFSLYRVRRGVPFIQELRTVSVAWVTLFTGLALLSVITKTSNDYSRLWFGLWFGLGFLCLLASRLAIRGILARLRMRGINHSKMVIVGGSDLAKEAAERIKLSPELGYDIVGFFSDFEGAKTGDIGNDIEFLGASADTAAYVSRNHVDQVWIAMSLEQTATIKQVVDSLDTSTVDVCYIPDIFSFSLLNHSVSEVGDMPLVNISVSPMSGVNRLIKALEDRIIAALILAIISPAMLILAIGVKLSSPGPVFYRQERVSWNGQHFEMLKFRSMPVDSEKDGIQWGGGRNKAALPFGQFIRRTSLDELPQFLNVLMGQMSIVGPRPERPVFVEQFKAEIPGYMKKHKVKAGITGWAQINGWRGDTDLTKRVEYDLYYIRNWSPWLDIKIIFFTIFKGFVSKHAY